MPTKEKTRTPKKKQSRRGAAPNRKRRRWPRILASVVALGAIGGVTYLLINGNGTETALPMNAIGSAVTTVQSAVTRATHGVRSFFTNWRSYDALEAENTELQHQITQLTLQLNEAKEDQAENDRLLSLVGGVETYDTLEPVYARVIGRDVGQWFSSFSIDKGSASGLMTGMAVVNSDGLIGHIYEVGMNYAKVLTVIDSRSGLACLIQRTRDSGIMRGSVSGIADNARCNIYYLPNVNSIIPGDTVITSGTDSLYPKGLLVGTVSEVSLSAGSEGGYAVVEPAVDFLHIEEVLVLRTLVATDQEETLPALMTPSPAPSATPGPTPDPNAIVTPDPDAGEGNWYYPSASNAADSSAVIEMLPEDDWVDEGRRPLRRFYLKIIMPALTLVLGILLDTSVIPVFYQGELTLSITLIVILCISLRLGFVRGAVYGMGAGLLIDASCGSVPRMTFAFLAAGLLCGLLVPENIVTELSVLFFHLRRLIISLALTGAIELIMNIAVYFRTADFSWHLAGMALARTVLTALAVVLICPVLSRMYPRRAMVQPSGSASKDAEVF